MVLNKGPAEYISAVASNIQASAPTRSSVQNKRRGEGCGKPNTNAAGKIPHSACCVFDVMNSSDAAVNNPSVNTLAGCRLARCSPRGTIRTNPSSAATSEKKEFKYDTYNTSVKIHSARPP